MFFRPLIIFITILLIYKSTVVYGQAGNSQIIFNGAYIEKVKKAGPLKPGGIVHDLFFGNVLNYKNGTMRLSDFTGRVVILDFWSSSCSGCISLFPKTEEFNEFFKEKLIIIPVTWESAAQFEKLKSISPIARNARLPFVLNDTVLLNMFPHLGQPYYVWIDENGKIMGDSRHTAITKNIINKVLSEKNNRDSIMKQIAIHQPTKAENYYKDRASKRVLNGKVYYSGLTRINIAEIRGGGTNSRKSIIDTMTREQCGYTINGTSIFKLILRAYESSTRENIFLEDDSLKAIFPPIVDSEVSEWERENMFNYTFWSSSNNYKKYSLHLDDFIKNDLLEEFGIWGEYKLLERPCYVLRKDGVVDMNNISITDSEFVAEQTKEGIYIANGGMNVFLDLLKSCLYKSGNGIIPLIDETGYSTGRTRLINLYIKWSNYSNLEELNISLNKLGLKLYLEKRKLITLVLNLRTNKHEALSLVNKNN